jgi:hypothetical protein
MQPSIPDKCYAFNIRKTRFVALSVVMFEQGTTGCLDVPKAWKAIATTQDIFSCSAAKFDTHGVLSKLVGCTMCVVGPHAANKHDDLVSCAD